MVVKMGEILNAVQPLQKIRSLTFNGRAAFYIARLLNKLQSELDTFNSAREVMIEKYRDPENPDKIADDKIDEFNKEIISLLEDEIDIDVISLKLSWLDEMDFSIDEIAALEPFIDED